MKMALFCAVLNVMEKRNKKGRMVFNYILLERRVKSVEHKVELRSRQFLNFALRLTLNTVKLNYHCLSIIMILVCPLSVDFLKIDIDILNLCNPAWTGDISLLCTPFLIVRSF